MTKKKVIHTVHENHFNFTRQQAGLFFLGVGLTLFILNMVSMINMLELILAVKDQVQYPFLGFWISTFASLILMGYSAMNIYNNEK
ncbi:MAG: hypothetical protein VX028_01805 [Nanoarchaeota archaeon]|nr:hypothetical protein [Nanoarchaeota archaeon]